MRRWGSAWQQRRRRSDGWRWWRRRDAPRSPPARSRGRRSHRGASRRSQDAERVGAVECSDCHEKVQGHAEHRGVSRATARPVTAAAALHAESQEPEDIRFPSAARLSRLSRERARHASRVGHRRARARRPALLRLPQPARDRRATTCASARGTALAPRAAAPRRSLPGASAARASASTATRTSPRASSIRRTTRSTRAMLTCTSCHDPHGDSRVAARRRDAALRHLPSGPGGPVDLRARAGRRGLHRVPRPARRARRRAARRARSRSSASAATRSPTSGTTTPAGTGIRGNTGATEDFPPPGSGAAIKPLEARTFLRDCTNCHGAIHGSYTDETLQH